MEVMTGSAFLDDDALSLKRLRPAMLRIRWVDAVERPFFAGAHTDVFAWTTAHMTGVPRVIMVGGEIFNTKHKVNKSKHVEPVKQKKRSMAPKRNEAIHTQVEELTKDNFLREVKYQTWVSNPVIAKKAMEYLNSKKDEEKTAFYTREGVFCYKRLPFGLKNAGATYQRLIDKVFSCQKCSFRGEEGRFSGHLIIKQGIKEDPSKVKAISDLQPPKSEYEPTTVEEKQDMRNEMKARGTLLMTLPNKDQLKFHSYKDAKFLMEAIEKRLQKLITQLKIQGEIITQEDMNLKLSRSLPSEWKTHALIWRNKQEIDTISLDDLYNNLKIYEPEISRSSSTSQNQQNVAFVSSNSTKAIVAQMKQITLLMDQPNSPQMSREDLEQINPDDLEEMDLQWEIAMLTIRARRFIKRTSRQLDVNGQRVGFLSSSKIRKKRIVEETCPVEINENVPGFQDGIRGYKLELTKLRKSILTNFALIGIYIFMEVLPVDSEVDSCLELVEARLAHYKKNEAVFEESINVFKLEVKLRDIAFVKNKKKLEKEEKERDELKLTLEKFQNSSKSLNNILESQVIDKFKTRLGYNTASSTTSSPVVESFGNPQQKEYKEKGVIDSGCSRHMTGNKCYLTEYEDYDGGFVSFRDGKGRISRKGKIKTGTLDFDNVYFCKELKYNLFSVSQICDKKNNVLFTDTECLVLSSDFKLLDESQVLLRVPRKDNIYSVDLKSVVPTKGLTCLFAKATINESNLWHIRLGHINFKDMNKLIRGNLVRGSLGKFDVKPDEGFFVGYSVVRKAMRVFNKMTRIIDETLNIRFLENTSNVTGNGSNWHFDVDSLAISMNYVPVVVGKQTNGIVGTRYYIVTDQAEEKTVPKQEFILIPFRTTGPLISQGPKDSEEDSGMKPTKVDESRASMGRITVGPSCIDDDLSSPVNAAKAFNAFEEHLFE
ncbi:ribonuclease H-like domain-containing protein [Tanacetum coccineum]|uniref:Ribonuclease H-like domain-containing protein n=1 Tax=Tanacetum coccineum TaxID=301880 RepID=A0ABQ5FH50_9ASTR